MAPVKAGISRWSEGLILLALLRARLALGLGGGPSGPGSLKIEYDVCRKKTIM
jgi:hypothetical protein